jgi:hypothetical protein
MSREMEPSATLARSRAQWRRGGGSLTGEGPAVHQCPCECAIWSVSCIVAEMRIGPGWLQQGLARRPVQNSQANQGHQTDRQCGFSVSFAAFRAVPRAFVQKWLSYLLSSNMHILSTLARPSPRGREALSMEATTPPALPDAMFDPVSAASATAMATAASQKRPSRNHARCGQAKEAEHAGAKGGGVEEASRP